VTCSRQGVWPRKRRAVWSPCGQAVCAPFESDSTLERAAGSDERCPQLWAKRLVSIRRTRRERHWPGEATGRGFIPRAARRNGLTISKNHFGSGVHGDARSTVVLASRLDCRGVKKAAQRLLTGPVPQRTWSGGSGRPVVRGGSSSLSHGAQTWQGERLRVGGSAAMSIPRVFDTEGAGARWSSLGRGDQFTELRANERTPWSGSRTRSTEAFRGESREALSARHVPRHPLQGWAGTQNDLRVGRRVSPPIHLARAPARATGSRSRGHRATNRRHGEGTAR
jgi:hypothetical protein